MPLDGLTLSVLINELNPLLKNGRVLKIYQPNDTTITMQLRLPGKTETLLISTDALYPRIHTIQGQPKNPLNPPAFCMLLRKYLEPSRLLKIEQVGYDRIAHLHFEGIDEGGQLVKLVLVAELMGRQSNLYLINRDGIILDSLKRFPEKGIAPGKSYQPPSDQGKIDPSQADAEQFMDELRLLPGPTPIWKWIGDTFQGFSKVAAQEVLRRADLDHHLRRSELESKDWLRVHKSFKHLVQELEKGGTPTWYRENPRDFTAYDLTGFHGERFATTNHLIETVLGKKQDSKHLEEVKRAIRKKMTNHLKRVTKKEAIQEATLQEAKDADLYRHQGELLTASFHLIPEGADCVEVPDYMQDGTPMVTIALNPHLSPSKNVQRIFKRYTKAKASQKYTNQQLQKTKLERNYLEDIFLQIDLANELDILEEIEAELQKSGYLKVQNKPGSKKIQKSKVYQGPERYVSVDGLTILVGRNNSQNDHLTFRLTGPNHLWLHARNIPGSHVSILSDGAIPEDTLLQAAHLAAYFSKQRNSPKVPIDYTLRKHVRKPKGANPGFVHYNEAKTILVNPTDFQFPPRQL